MDLEGVYKENGVYTDLVSKLCFQTRRCPEFLSDKVGDEAVQLE